MSVTMCECGGETDVCANCLLDEANAEIKRLRAALDEAERAQFRRLYLDCDGVLADFDAHFLATFGLPPRDYEDKHGAGIFWRDIQSEAPTFYRDLPLMPDARALVEGTEVYRPIILTGCPLGGWAEAQKLAWAHEHFPGMPMIVCMARDKRQFCRPGDILIDDRPRYQSRWEEAGGVFILHTSAASSLALIAALKDRPS